MVQVPAILHQNSQTTVTSTPTTHHKVQLATDQLQEPTMSASPLNIKNNLSHLIIQVEIT